MLVALAVSQPAEVEQTTNEPHLIETEKNSNDAVMFLLGACKADGLGSSCSDGDECCSGCCHQGFCFADDVCERICMPVSRLSVCAINTDCCEQCCKDNQCVASDQCPKFPPAWLIWLLCIAGGVIVVGVAVCIILCVMRSNRQKGANAVAYSSVDQ